MNLFGDVVNFFVGNSSSSPNQTFKVVELDAASIGALMTKESLGARNNTKSKYSVVKWDNENLFLLLRELQKQNETFHVTVSYGKKCYSLYRGANVVAATDEYERFLRNRSLIVACLRSNKEKIFKDLVEQIHNNPNWQSIHYACTLNILHLYVEMNDVNTQAMPDGLFPLHIAARAGNCEAISQLISRGGSVMVVDPSGMNPLHYAATKDYDTVTAFRNAPQLPAILQNENARGETPLSLCLDQSKPGCLKGLLELGVSTKVNIGGKPLLIYMLSLDRINPNHLECLMLLLKHDPTMVNEIDSSTGENVFHVAVDSANMNIVLQFSASLTHSLDSINKQSKSGYTPLMCQLIRANFNCFVKLLSYGADCTIKNKQGLNVFHMTVEKGALEFVKALLIFHMDLSNIPVDVNYRHLASTSRLPSKKEILKCLDVVKAPYCCQRQSDCNEDCLVDKSQGIRSAAKEPTLHTFAQTLSISNVIAKKKNGSRLENVLSLDGGGIKGLLIVQSLLYISKTLNSKIFLSNFNWVCGTSTGAILAAAMACGKSLEECQRLYFQLKDDIFVGSGRPYDAVALERFLKHHLGGTKTLEEITSVKLILTSVIGNVLPMRMHLFRNYQLPYLSKAENSQLGYRDPNNEFLWKAVRCSSAAPTYFSSVDDKFIDGGMLANNPTLDILTEINTYNMALRMNNKNNDLVEIGCILSIGTGQIPETLSSTLNLQTTNTIMGIINTAFAVKDMTKILLHQVTESDCRPVDIAKSMAHANLTPYFRFSTPLKKELSLDETDNGTLIDALWQTMEYLYSRNDDVEQLCALFNNC